MTIEYKIKFENETVTITQSVTGTLGPPTDGVSGGPDKPGTVGGGPENPGAVGGGPDKPGAVGRGTHGPLTNGSIAVILGPLVIGGSSTPIGAPTGEPPSFGINSPPPLEAGRSENSDGAQTLPLTMFCQEEVNWCWAAASSAVRGYLPPKAAVTQCAVATEVVGKATGVSCCTNRSACNVIQTVGAALGPRLQEAVPGRVTFAVIQDQIDRLKRPLCVRIAWDVDHDGFEDGGHVVVISGWSIVNGVEYVMVKDPDGGRNLGTPTQAITRKVPFETFQTAYRGCGIWEETFLVKEA